MLIDLIAGGLGWLVAVPAALLALLTGYLLLLTLAALITTPRRPLVGAARTRFAILIPAHDEQQLIGRLLDSLARLDYPAERVSVHVVADNCSDQTAAIARSYRVSVHERFDDEQRAKGFALRWLLRRLAFLELRYDAYVVLDADSVVDPSFLRALDARLSSGSQVIQAYYSVLNAAESPLASLRYSALAALHYLRPLGRARLGLSCGLKGNGMCFAAAVLDRFGWSWFTLAEDVEFHLALVRGGLRVDFAPEARVLADMPVTLAQAVSQNERWERGRLLLARKQVAALLLDGCRRRSALRIDAALEQVIPPLSVPFALGAACLLAGLGLGHTVDVWLASISLVGQGAYLLVALALVGAPWRMYLALAYAPLYIVWKVALYAQAVGRGGGQPWVRTARVG